MTDPRDVARPERAAAAVIESTGAISFDPTFASFGARALGFLVDLLATLLLMAPGIALAVSGGLSPAGVFGVGVAFLGFFVAAMLSARGVAESGRWLGNRVAQTTVVDATNGDHLALTHAFTRFVLRGLISPVLLFGFIVAFTDSQRRGFHDHAVGSIVTRAAPETWAVGDD